jgi:hypothetical protein
MSESGREELDRRRGSTTITVSADTLLENLDREIASSRLKILIKPATKLPLSLEEFCALFVEDKASHGYDVYVPLPPSLSLSLCSSPQPHAVR